MVISIKTDKDTLIVESVTEGNLKLYKVEKTIIKEIYVLASDPKHAVAQANNDIKGQCLVSEIPLRVQGWSSHQTIQ